ncbi:MAG TPA: UDP-N-acetylglucosamine 2-epimerase (non-hydrolyzing) [bacterium]|nr:UDP-N-acetylglucosamine 2-epimerase (non-hydrolyzing) [bacterium]
MKIDLIVGARPNFMKAAPLYHILQKETATFEIRLVHTGQHYDEAMSDIFFNQLGLPEPDVYLGVGSGTHAEQSAAILVEYEKLLMDSPTDLVLVVGDVNSTMACALVAKKLHTNVGHIEAGLRSFDREMPEEINRIVTDSISDYLFTTSHDANEHLTSEGHSEDQIFFVGNLMIDSLNNYIERADCTDLLASLGVQAGEYGLITLHRPSNVDDPGTFTDILEAFHDILQYLPLIFPAHPRTQKQITQLDTEGYFRSMRNFHLIDPVGYLEFIALEKHAKVILTDSGGIQEESTVLGVPCLTLRLNTERPVTITEGTNRLVKPESHAIVNAITPIINGKRVEGGIPEKWDGHTAERITEVLKRIKSQQYADVSHMHG